MSWSRIDSLGRDIRYTCRMLGRTPAFTVPAVASLALGIAVNTVLFSVVNAALLRPLGHSGAGDLVRIGRSVRNDGAFRSVAYQDLLYLREHASSLEAIAGHQLESLVLTAEDSAEIVLVETVTANYFSVLGVPPALGRGFSADEDRAGAAPVAVISHRFWRRHFDGNPSVVGNAIRLNDREIRIVGVAASTFRGSFPGVDIDLWLPARTLNVVLNRADDRDPMLMLVARLEQGASIPTARAELQVLARRLIELDQNRHRAHGFTIAGARGIHPGFARVVRPFLLLLMGVVGVVLLIACTNVAGLLLARGNARQGELALRRAVGAARGRLVAQLFVESTVLALAGGVAGLLLSYWPVRLLNELKLANGPTGSPIFFNLQLDTRVLIFTAVASMLTALVFGLAPAMQTTKVSLTGPLKESTGATGIRRSRLRSALMVAQVALSCVLLIGAALLFKSVRYAGRVDLGFDPDRVAIASFDLRTLGANRQRTELFYSELLSRARTLPGVERAALADFVPMGDPGAGRFRVPGIAPPPGAEHYEVAYGVVSDQYFATVRQPLRRGREFTPDDRAGAPLVAIVNEALARRASPQKDALGQRLRLVGEGEREYEIVGIVRDARFWALTGEIEPLVLLPAAQHYAPPLVLHVRVAGRPSDVLPALKRLASEIDRTVPFSGQSMREGMDFTLVPARIAQAVFAIAGVIALSLASIGLYALVWYSLEQRLKEIGVRVALGATRSSVFRLIVGSALRLTVVGVTIGVVVAASSARVLSAFLYGVSSTDPLTFSGIAGLLVLVALAAGYSAARKGLNLDPMVALRHE